MQTSNDLLRSILGVLAQINNKTTPQAAGGGAPRSTTGSVLGNLFDMGKEPAKKASAIKDMASALPDIAKGMTDIGNIKHRKLKQATLVIKSLWGVLNEMGSRKGSARVTRASASLALLADALNKLARPINTLSKFFLNMGIGILSFVGAIALSMLILKTQDPWEVIGFIGGTIAIMVGAFLLLGKFGGTVKKGAKTVKSMGVAMGLLSIGILAFALTIKAVGVMFGSGTDWMGVLQSVGIIASIIGGISLAFWAIGKFSSAIGKGALTAIVMSLGMIALAGGVYLLALAGKAIGDLATEGEEKEVDFFGTKLMIGLGTIGLVIVGAAVLFGVMGIPVVAAALALGSGVAILVSAAMYALALSVREVSKIASTMDGDEVASNLTTLISATFIGLRDGVGQGLLGEAKGKNWWQKTGIIAKNTVAIMAGIALLSGVSVAISLFALSLRAFESVGQIAPIIGHDTNGHPIYGPPVTVSEIATNIATSIGTFFTVLGEQFGEGGAAIPSAKMMGSITAALMGTSYTKVLGLPLPGSGVSLMDALYKYGEVLKFWGQFGAKNEIPAGVDAQGNPTKPVPVTTVAGNIAKSLTAFFEALGSDIIDMDDNLAEQTAEVAQILLGKKAFKILGIPFLKIGRDRPGILEPVAKFAEIAKLFAEGNYIDPVTGEAKKINYQTVAKNIVKSLSVFTIELVKTLNTLDSNKLSRKGEKAIESFEILNDQFIKLIENRSELDKTADTISRVAASIESLGTSLSMVDADTLGSLSNVSVSGAGGGRSEGANEYNNVIAKEKARENWEEISVMIGDEVGNQVALAFQSGMFRFEFDTSRTGGIMYWNQQ